MLMLIHFKKGTDVITKLRHLHHFIAAVLCLVPAAFAIASGVAPQMAESVLVKSNDTQLYVELRGRSEHSPLLLYLHGGPGNAFGLISFRAYVGPQLESRYLVAYLHQRGVANSPAVPDSTQTVANHIADVKNVVRYLRTRFPNRRIYLLGHSWGGSLAVLSAVQNPGPVDGVIDVAGPFNTQAALSASYGMTLRWATETANAEAIRDLKAIGPPPYSDPERQRKLSNWASSAYGGLTAHLSQARLLSREPFMSIKPEWQAVQIRVINAMNFEFGRLNMEPQLKKQQLPLLVIVGRRDAVIPASGMRSGYDLYGGRKKWVELSESHHLAFVDEPDTFVKAIEGFVR